MRALRHYSATLMPGILAFAAFLAAPPAAAVTVRLGEVVSSGDGLIVPVVLPQTDQPVAGMDAVFNYDPAVLSFVAVETGPVVGAAGKRLTSHQRAPGILVLVVQGLNQTAMDSGEVARIRLRRNADAPGGETALVLARTTLTTPDAEAVASEGTVRTLTLDSAPGRGGPLREVVPAPRAGPPDPQRQESGADAPRPDSSASAPAAPAPRRVADRPRDERDALAVAIRAAEAVRKRIGDEREPQPNTPGQRLADIPPPRDSQLSDPEDRSQPADSPGVFVKANAPQEGTTPPEDTESDLAAAERVAMGSDGELAGTRMRDDAPALPERFRSPPSTRRATGWLAVAAGVTLLLISGVALAKHRR